MTSREGRITGITEITGMKTAAIIGEMVGDMKAKIADLLKIAKGIGVILAAARAVPALLEIMTALTEAMEGRTIDSASLRPVRDSYLRARSRIRRSIGMKRSAESARRRISALRRI